MISYEDITAPAARGPGSDARSVATKEGGGESASASFRELPVATSSSDPPRSPSATPGRAEDRAGNEPSRSLKFHNHGKAVTTAFTT